MTNGVEVFESQYNRGKIYLSWGSETIDLELLKEGKEGSTCHFLYFFNNYEDKLANARFSFSTLPGCCGIVVSHDTNRVNFRSHDSKAVSNYFREIKEEFARYLGYSAMLATTDMSKVASVGNMLKSKYNMLEPFKNKRTGNLIGVGVKPI